MVDWAKRVKKERADDLAAGETLLAASYFQGRGSAAGQIAFGMVRGVGGDILGTAAANVKAQRAGTAASGRAKEGYNTFEGSLAAQLPNDKGVIAVTDRRIVIFGYSAGMVKTKIEDVQASIDREHLVGWSYKSGKLTSILNMAFSDDSDVGLELPRANKPAAFAATLSIPEVE